MKKLLTIWLLMFCFGLSAQVHVKGYYRKDGTYVRPHTRSNPKSNNKAQYKTNRSTTNNENINWSKINCTYGHCEAIAKSTGERCNHCVSKRGDKFCWQHPLSEELKKENKNPSPKNGLTEKTKNQKVLRYSMLLTVNFNEGIGMGIQSHSNENQLSPFVLINQSLTSALFLSPYGLQNSYFSTRDKTIRTYNNTTSFIVGAESKSEERFGILFGVGIKKGHQHNVVSEYSLTAGTYESQYVVRLPQSEFLRPNFLLGLKYYTTSNYNLIFGINFSERANNLNNTTVYLGFTRTI